MLSEFFEQHWNENGKPAGGVSCGKGFCISWQNGPLGIGDNRKEPNGAFVETIIAATRARIAYYQNSQFNCEENAEAIFHLTEALNWLNKRTSRRINQKIEGTHQGN